MRFNIKSMLGGLFLLLVITGCRDNNNAIPLVAVDREINLTLPSYSALSVPGGWAYLTGGSKGIIVYNKGNNEFAAYDRHSPYNVDEECTVSVDSTNNIQIIDPCSGSIFSLQTGSVTQGPAVLPLKQYNTYLSGSILRIYN